MKLLEISLQLGLTLIMMVLLMIYKIWVINRSAKRTKYNDYGRMFNAFKAMDIRAWGESILGFFILAVLLSLIWEIELSI